MILTPFRAGMRRLRGNNHPPPREDVWTVWLRPNRPGTGTTPMESAVNL